MSALRCIGGPAHGRTYAISPDDDTFVYTEARPGDGGFWYGGEHPSASRPRVETHVYRRVRVTGTGGQVRFILAHREVSYLTALSMLSAWLLERWLREDAG